MQELTFDLMLIDILLILAVVAISRWIARPLARILFGRGSINPESVYKGFNKTFDFARRGISVRTIYYAGNSAAIEQAAMYTGGKPVHGIVHRYSNRLLVGLISSLPESDPVDAKRIPTFAFPLWLPQLAFYHCVRRPFLWTRGYREQHSKAVRPVYLDTRKLDLAGPNDVARLKLMLEEANKMLDREPNTGVKPALILYGASRGASTVIAGVIDMNNSEPAMLRHVIGCVAEAPFGTVDDVLEFRFGSLASLASRFLEVVSSYKWSQHTPSEKAHNHEWPTQIPLLIVACRKDLVVPYQSSSILHNTLAKANPRAQIKMLTLEEGDHSLLPVDSPVGAAIYKRAVDAFYELCCKRNKVILD